MKRLTDSERAMIDGVLIGLASSISDRAMRVIAGAVERMYQIECEQSIDNLTHYDRHRVCVEFVLAKHEADIFEDRHTREMFITKLYKDNRDIAIIETCRQTGKTTENPIDNSTNEASSDD